MLLTNVSIEANSVDLDQTASDLGLHFLSNRHLNRSIRQNLKILVVIGSLMVNAKILEKDADL